MTTPRKNPIHASPDEQQAYALQDANQKLEQHGNLLEGIHHAIADKSDIQNVAPQVNQKLDELNSTNLGSLDELQKIKQSQKEHSGLLQTILEQMKHKSVPVELLGMEQMFIQGEKGEKGEKGEVGDKGDGGEKGNIGEKGEQGMIGFPGVAGQDGRDGRNGIDGIDGEDGEDGKHADEIDGKGIVTKLSELPPKERLSYRFLKDLPKIYDPSDYPQGRGTDQGGGGGSILNFQDSTGALISQYVQAVKIGSGFTTAYSNGVITINSPGAGTGTVTNVSVVTANGVSGSVANPTTTPAITLSLGAITPTSVAASGTVTGSNLSGTNTGDQTNISGTAAGLSVVLVPASGGTGVANNNAMTVTGSGNFAYTRTLTGTTNVTFPTSGTLATLAGTETFSNKRITRRVVTTTQSATPTINTDNTDVAYITGLAQAVTSFTTNLSGTPVNGDMLIIDITDNGTGRALTFGSSFESSTVTLPTTTVASTKLTIGFRWNIATSKWTCVAVA